VIFLPVLTAFVAVSKSLSLAAA